MSPAGLLVFGVVALGTMLVAVRLSVRRWIAWTQRAADYATTEILLASNVDSPEAVAVLRQQFEAWQRVVSEATAKFCRADDAQRVKIFQVPELDGLAGYNDEHRYIIDATTEQVRRLRDLAARLEQGRTSLRRLWVPRVV